jgi:hypothetical protein
VHYLKCFFWPAIAALLSLAPVLKVCSQTGTNDLVIYDDGLENGFEDWGWATRNLLNTDPIHSGSVSVSVTAKAWEGLYFWHRPMSTVGYDSVSFWANGGEHGLQLLRIRGMLSGKEELGDNVPVLPPNRWRQYKVSLSDIGVANKTNFTGIEIVLAEGATNTFYVDDVQLDAKVQPVAATAVKTAPSAQPPPVPALARTAPPEPAAPMVDQTPERSVWWILGSLMVIISLLACLVLLFWRRGRPPTHSTAMLASPGNAVGDPATAEEWRQRALTAEAMAGKQGQMLREKIMPELTEFAKQSLVQGLYTQRNTLLETQQKAAQAMLELETRLSALQLPLQERIRAYEQRIAELEKEVESQGEEVRELARATLMLVRKKLDDERERERTPSRFN